MGLSFSGSMSSTRNDVGQRAILGLGAVWSGPRAVLASLYVGVPVFYVLYFDLRALETFAGSVTRSTVLFIGATLCVGTLSVLVAVVRLVERLPRAFFTDIADARLSASVSDLQPRVPGFMLGPAALLVAFESQAPHFFQELGPRPAYTLSLGPPEMGGVLVQSSGSARYVSPTRALPSCSPRSSPRSLSGCRSAWSYCRSISGRNCSDSRPRGEPSDRQRARSNCGVLLPPDDAALSRGIRQAELQKSREAIVSNTIGSVSIRTRVGAPGGDTRCVTGSDRGPAFALAPCTTPGGIPRRRQSLALGVTDFDASSRPMPDAAPRASRAPTTAERDRFHWGFGTPGPGQGWAADRLAENLLSSPCGIGDRAANSVDGR